MSSTRARDAPVIETLSTNFELEHFDCGKEELNRFLLKFALTNQQSGGSRTYVASQAGTVIGYYSLSAGSVMHVDAPVRVTKGQPRHPIPVMLLARLAVDRKAHRKGIGQGLLKDALLRTNQAADIAGIRALLVHAKDDEARQFYQHFNFEPSPTNPYHLFLLVKDIRRLLRG